MPNGWAAEAAAMAVQAAAECLAMVPAEANVAPPSRCIDGRTDGLRRKGKEEEAYGTDGTA